MDIQLNPKIIISKHAIQRRKHYTPIEKDILINSGKYPISDIGVEAPVYSEVLCKLFKKLKKNIWKNKEYQYLINLGLKEVNYCQKASWCKFKSIDSKEISNDKY